MEYRILETQSAAALEHQVNSLIAEGWLPTGGLSVATYGAGAWWFYQAMVRRTASEDRSAPGTSPPSI